MLQIQTFRWEITSYLQKVIPIGLEKQCLAKTYPKMKYMYECFYQMYVIEKKGQSIIRAKIFPQINHINFKNIIYVVKIFQLLPRR